MADTASEQVQNRPPVSDQQHSDSEDAPGQADLLSLLQRERADFANYRRRAAQDRAEEGDRARANQLVALLPILDDLDRAFAQTPDELRDHPWIRGIALGQNRLLEFLAMSGVEPFGAEGDPFDPASHEALFFEERPGLDDRQVASVIRPGYRTATRVLRPAHVGVAGPPDASGGATDNRSTDDA
jgi:molecular chaperone GrpE